MSTQTEIPTIRRLISAAPRRTPTVAWQLIESFLNEVFSSHDLREQLEIVLFEVARQAQMLIVLQELIRVEVAGEDVLCIAVDVAYGSLDAEDDIEPPLVPISDVGHFQNMELTMVVRDRLGEVRDMINLMGYRAPEGIAVRMRNDHLSTEQREHDPVPNPIEL